MYQQADVMKFGASSRIKQIFKIVFKLLANKHFTD